MSMQHLSRVVSALVLALCLPGLAQADAGVPRQPGDGGPDTTRLGLNVSFLDETLLNLARNSGAGHDRVDFPMAQLQPWAGAWDWAIHDQLVAAERAHGLSVLGVLTQPPAWAAPSNMIPTGLDLPWNDPGNVWAQYVYQVARRYKDTVHAWQVWNEPDLDKYWPGPPDAVDDNARMRPFARLMKVSYQAIKAANPDAIVVTAGFLYRVDNNQGQPRVIALWQELNADPQGAANGYYFDAAAFHLYDGGTCEQPGLYYYDVVNDFRYHMARWVGDHPLWITEAGIRQSEEHGFGTRPPSTDRYATLEEAASYVIQNYAYALHKNAARYFYVRTRDDVAGGPENWGLVRPDNTTRPSYLAYQVAARYLPITYAFSTRAWTPYTATGPVSRISFWGTPAGRVSVVWNIGHAPETYVFASRIPTVTLVRQDGITATLISPGNQFTFTLDPAPNFNLRPERDMCLVASQPLILIERDVTPPTAALTLTANLSATAAVTLTWSGQDDLSGVWYYDLQMRRGGMTWTQLLTATAATRRIVDVEPGASYAFRARAHDRVGNPQDWATAPVALLEAGDLPRRVFVPGVFR